ncbi:AraC family transcriptional regulator [Chitinophaga silvatica]|uniref:AraC family transcriptional regulator n=1 Tax=Chitinophaga silvatica TaxID=2282649 RepID=A0A3E1YE17_9BACT|nr:helix-turn-helix domain-containing protein [Chitinophaga silvatica]RFS24751.1 AraC family transcriptional regulator [Chitinophaga silvatica]
MLLNEIKPGSLLADNIRLYRIIDFRFPDSLIVPCKVYPPRPEFCLQFFPKDMETAEYPDSRLTIGKKRTIIMGQHSKVIHRYPGREFLCLQIIFQPGGFYRITNIPSEYLANKYMDAEEVFGKNINLITEQLFHAKEYTEMIEIVERFLTDLIRKSKMNKHSVDEISIQMIKEEELYSVDKFLHSAFLSHRQFDRKFKERIGMPPKQFLQLIRFDRAFRMKNRFPHKDWLSIALHCGYHDYQHLTKDYKEFTGHTPVQFFEIDNKAPERALGDVEI